jgi:hypothetical protein
MAIISGGKIIEVEVSRPLIASGAPSAGTSEVQTLTIGGTPDGGTFTLSFAGFTTSAISWTATDATLVSAIDAALEALPSIGTGGVVVADSTLTSGIGDATITFGGNLAKLAVPLITATSSLTGTDPTIEIAETTPGVTATARGAGQGQMYINSSDGDLYINTGTALVPVWAVVGGQS